MAICIRITICQSLSQAVAAGQVKGNRHVIYPKETPLNNLLLTMLDKAGVSVESFGDAQENWI